jgi:hypothetical protein
MDQQDQTANETATAEQQQAASTTEGAEQQQQAAAVEETSGGEQQTQQTEKPAPEKPKTDWRDRRIAQQSERMRALQRENEELKASAGLTKPLDPNADFDRRVAEAAAQQAEAIAARRAFDARVADAYQAGLKQFPGEFDQKVAALKGVVDWSDPAQQQAYNQFLIAALETGEAPRLISQLGSDPSEASRIMALPAVRMAVELAKMAATEPTQTSSASRPITPVTQTGSNRTQIRPDDPERADQLSTAEWMRRRNEQEAALRQARR